MLWLNESILVIMCFFMVAGALDYYILNRRLNLGNHFYDAFMMMGPLALSMVGIISLAPVISEITAPWIGPIFTALGADPSMFASMILAIDMGAYSLAESLALTDEAANFSWAFLGTMMGPTLVFTIPVALTIIQKEDHPYFAKGILIGIVTIPVGCLTGGALAGYKLGWMVPNLLPALLLSAVIGMGLWLFTYGAIRLFAWFGKGIEILIIIGLVAITIETLTGTTLIPGLAPLSEGVSIVGRITVTLAGAYPLLAFINQKGAGMWKRLSGKIGLNAEAMTGLLASLAHHLPMFAMMKNMGQRGKVVNSAFAVSGAFAFGSHLAFVAGFEKDMIFPVIVGKLVAGLLAVGVALFATRKDEPVTLTK